MLLIFCWKVKLVKFGPIKVFYNAGALENIWNITKVHALLGKEKSLKIRCENLNVSTCRPDHDQSWFVLLQWKLARFIDRGFQKG